MSLHPVGLTIDQLAVVVDAAKVPAQRLSRFLDSVVDLLLPLDAITDAAVQSAIARVLKRLGQAA